MATNLERLRKMKSSNLKKEANLSTSFSIDEGDGITLDNEKKEQLVDARVNESKKSGSAPKSPINDEKKTATKTESKNKPNIVNKTSEPIKPIKPINAIDDNQQTSLPEKNLGFRLSSEEDLTYLNMAPLGRATTKKAFFITLMEEAIKESVNANIGDETVSAFRNGSLKTTQVTIAVPEELISSIKMAAARYMMKPQRYIAYVIHQARVTDSSWQVI